MSRSRETPDRFNKWKYRRPFVAWRDSLPPPIWDTTGRQKALLETMVRTEAEAQHAVLFWGETLKLAELMVSNAVLNLHEIVAVREVVQADLERERSPSIRFDPNQMLLPFTDDVMQVHNIKTRRWS